MNDLRLMELMNQEIDGVNSAAETRELKDHLEGHPESRRVYGELREAVDIFEKVRPLDLPDGLHEAILAATGPVPPPRRKDRRSTLRHFFSPVLRPAVATSFAVGLVAGLIILGTFRNLETGSRGASPNHLQGMAGQDRDTLSLAPVLVRSLDGPLVAGEMTVTAAGQGAVIEIEITSQTSVTVTLGYHRSWEGTDFRTLAGKVEDLQVRHGTVSFATPGAGSWAIGLHRSANFKESVTLQIHHKGELVTEQTVIIQP